MSVVFKRGYKKLDKMCISTHPGAIQKNPGEPIMTKREIEKLLKKAGFQKHEGGRHEVWKKDGFQIVALPRHKGDISKGTVNSILKKAGIKQ